MTMLSHEIERLTTDWKPILLEIIKEFPDLDKQIIDKEDNIFPPQNLIFNAFDKFNFKDLKIIILGQDPYHGNGQANGLCFSVEDGIKIPPSLKNIFREMYSDLGEEFVLPKSGNLDYLAEQGILMLNNTLTVQEGNPNSHLKYWGGFSKRIIEYICANSVYKVFLLWGNNAKKSKKYVTGDHYVLEATHPSPLGANKGGWWGSKHFSQCNELLFELGDEQIEWIKK
jgi:uracil-DNA glycosylase